MIEVSLFKRDASQCKVPRQVLCNAQIPLCFLKKLSNGAIKSLAKNLNVTTIEELYFSPKELILEKISKRNLRKEIFEAKEKISQRALVKRKLIKFEDFAINKKIRLRPHQRALLIAISLFKEILKNIEQVIIFALDIFNQSVPYRERAIRKQLFEISMKAMRAA